jgi:hypothetical protein
MKTPKKVKLLLDNAGFKAGDIADVIRKQGDGYLVNVPGRESTSCYAPYVWYNREFLGKAV